MDVSKVNQNLFAVNGIPQSGGTTRLFQPVQAVNSTSQPANQEIAKRMAAINCELTPQRGNDVEGRKLNCFG